MHPNILESEEPLITRGGVLQLEKIRCNLEIIDLSLFLDLARKYREGHEVVPNTTTPHTRISHQISRVNWPDFSPQTDVGGDLYPPGQEAHTSTRK